MVHTILSSQQNVEWKQWDILFTVSMHQLLQNISLKILLTKDESMSNWSNKFVLKSWKIYETREFSVMWLPAFVQDWKAPVINDSQVEQLFGDYYVVHLVK